MALSVAVFAMIAVQALNQAPKAPAVRARPSPAPAASTQSAPFDLVVKDGVEGTVDIRGKQIEVRAILDRLKLELKIPISATPIVSAQKIDLALKNAPLSRLLNSLAPMVLADIEVGPDPQDAVWKGIHLTGYNEKEPARELKQVGFLIAAFNTEDDSITAEDIQAAEDKKAAKGLEEEEKDRDVPSLAVSVTDGRVTARSRKQPLAALLNEIATRAKVPFDMRGTLDGTLIDIELKDLPLRDLTVALGRPDVRLVIRRNLSTGEELVQGILVQDPPAAK